MAGAFPSAFDVPITYLRISVRQRRGSRLFLIRKYINLILAVGVDAPAFKMVFPKLKSTAMVFLCHRVIRRTLDYVATWENGLPMLLVFDQSPQSLAFHSAMLHLKRERKNVRESRRFLIRR